MRAGAGVGQQSQHLHQLRTAPSVEEAASTASAVALPRALRQWSTDIFEKGLDGVAAALQTLPLVRSVDDSR